MTEESHRLGMQAMAVPFAAKLPSSSGREEQERNLTASQGLVAELRTAAGQQIGTLSFPTD